MLRISQASNLKRGKQGEVTQYGGPWCTYVVEAAEIATLKCERSILQL
jgi:hypothetical protein